MNEMHMYFISRTMIIKRVSCNYGKIKKYLIVVGIWYHLKVQFCITKRLCFCRKNYGPNYRPFRPFSHSISLSRFTISLRCFYVKSFLWAYKQKSTLDIHFLPPQSSLIIASSSPWSVWFDYLLPAACLCSAPQGSDQRVRRHRGWSIFIGTFHEPLKAPLFHIMQ